MIICLPHVSSAFQEHFLEVIQNQEFLLLPTAEIVKLLSSDDINVPDEETIFQALMMWVRYDVQHRQQDLGMLLAFIRLPLLPPQVRELGVGGLYRDHALFLCSSLIATVSFHSSCQLTINKRGYSFLHCSRMYAYM